MTDYPKYARRGRLKGIRAPGGQLNLTASTLRLGMEGTSTPSQHQMILHSYFSRWTADRSEKLILSNGKFSSITFVCNRRAAALCLRPDEHHDHDEEGKDAIYPVQGDTMGRLLLCLFFYYRFHFLRVRLSNVEVIAGFHWEGGTFETWDGTREGQQLHR